MHGHGYFILGLNIVSWFLETVTQRLAGCFSRSLDLRPDVVDVALEDVDAGERGLEDADGSAYAAVAPVVWLALAQHFLLYDPPHEAAALQTVGGGLLGELWL